MATLSNFGKVANQIHTQHVSGSVYNAFNFKSGLEADLRSLSLSGEILRSLAFPQMLDRRADIEKAHLGTCKWIIDLTQFKEWISRSNGLLWIKGHPGSGKSTMMSFLFDKLEAEYRLEDEIRLNFFFSARGSTLQHTALGMLRSMLNQIFAQDEDIRPITRALFREKCQVYGENWSAWTWQRPELESLLSRSIAKSAEKRKLTLFVDALDEAGEQSARDIARYLLQLNDQIAKDSGNAKMLIACRHYPIASVVPGIEVWMEQYNQPDIVAFVKSRLFNGLLDENDSQWQTVTTVLLKRARGIFQWARLVVPMVEKLVLDGEQPTEIRQWLHRVPTELSQVYEQIIRTVIDTRSRRQSALLFQWVCLAERPLNLGEVYNALASDSAASLSKAYPFPNRGHPIAHAKQIQSRIKSLSGGLIEVSRPNDHNLNQTVQVVHQSVIDYLLDQGLAVVLSLQGPEDGNDARYWSNVESTLAVSQSHKTLYKCCLNYLTTFPTLVEKFKIQGMKARVTEAGDSGWQEQDTSTKSYERRTQDWWQIESWMRYVTENLFVHARLVTQFDSMELADEIRRLEPFMNKWVNKFRAHGPTSSVRPARDSNLLHVAAAFDLKDFVQHLIDANYNTDTPDGEGRSPFYIAASNGNLKVATALAQASANLRSELSHGLLQGPSSLMPMTPLTVAVAHNHESFVVWLLSQGVDVNDVTDGAENALMIAVRHGYYQLVRLLLEQGANVNQFSGRSFGYPLHVASYFGDMELLRILTDGGADVNIKGGRYGTAIRAAFGRRRMEAIRLLVAHGAHFDDLGSYHRLLPDLYPHDAESMKKIVEDYHVSPREDFDKYCIVSVATPDEQSQSLQKPPDHSRYSLSSMKETMKNPTSTG